MVENKISNITLVIGKIVSLYFLVTGIGFLVSGDYYSLMIAQKDSDPVLINLSGMVHFFIGMTIVTLHFKWKSFLEIAVTIFGFMFVLKGALLIALPELTLQTGNNSIQNSWMMALGFVIVGVVIGYFSFFSRYFD